MSCASCAGRVEKAIAGTRGVQFAAVNFADSTATVVFRDGPDPDAVIAAVADAGYDAIVEEAGGGGGGEPDVGDEEASRYRRAAVVAAAFAAPIVALDMGGHLFPAWHHWIGARIAETHLHWLYLGLASAVQFGPGLRFYRHGLPAIRRGSPDMNALVMIGTSAAWLFSAVAVLAPGLLPEGAGQIYFEASASIIALVLAGRWLEARARGETGRAIRRLAGLRPPVAKVQRGTEIAEVPVEDVRPGDRVVLRPGEKVPVDGEVIEGETYIDQAMITGEPVPVYRGPGDAVVGGTINTTGSVIYRATALGSDSVLARIIEMVRGAQGAKLPIQALVDKVTAVFVPVVLGVAAITFLAWMVWGPPPALAFAVVNAVAVLIIACPCAMGLATPTSIMVGTGRGAEMGILFRRGDALQSLASCRVIAFDKTGTLTVGNPAVTRIAVTGAAGVVGEEAALRWAASVEEQSEHPIARAVVRAARARGIAPDPEVRNFEAVAGLGVRARVRGEIVRVGSRRFLESEGIALSPEGLDEEAARAGTVLHLALGDRHLASFAVEDPVREATPEAVRMLRESGFRLAMITGDAASTAHAIAAKLGIERVEAGVMPDGKAEAVRRLQREGRVAFVGDGINDAPALAAADVGIAIGGATDVAMESAEVVLVAGDLRKVAAAIRLSRATLRNIRQNLFWAFGYNAALIPVAAGVLYPVWGVLLSPILAAAAMGLSSLCVLANALRLRNARI